MGTGEVFLVMIRMAIVPVVGVRVRSTWSLAGQQLSDRRLGETGSLIRGQLALALGDTLSLGRLRPLATIVRKLDA